MIYRRDEERYPSNLTDMEWELLKPLIPDASPGGRPRKTDMRGDECDLLSSSHW